MKVVQQKTVLKPKLVNALQMHNLTPNTFEYPEVLVSNLKIGKYVKVCASNERFWVNVTYIDGDLVIGKIDNILVFSNLHHLHIGDIIEFSKENIYDVMG